MAFPNPLLSSTHYDYILLHRPWMEEMVRDHIKADPGVLDRSHGLNASEAIKGERVERMLDGLARNARTILAGKRVDTRGMSTRQVLSHAPQGWIDDMVAATTGEYVSLLNYTIFGKRSFYFQGNLTERLADTDLNVPTESFALPFKSCMFVYDHQVARDALHAITGKKAASTGCVTVWLSLFGNGSEETLGIVAAHTDGDRCLAHSHRSLKLTGAPTVEDVIRTDHGRTDIGNLDDEVFYGPGFRFYRMVMNSVLYLSSSDPDLTEELHNKRPDAFSKLPYKEQAEIKRQLKAASQISFIRVGDGVPPVAAAPSDVQGRKLDHRFKVRSHWRLQPHGPGRSLRKTILVEEHWKGPDAAEVLSRAYVVR